MLAILALAAFSHASEPEPLCDVIVSGSVDALQEEIAAAPPGTTLCLEPGVYVGGGTPASFHLTSDLHLIGLGEEPTDVVLARTGETERPVVRVQGATATLRNLTLDGSDTHRNLHVSHESTVELVDCVVRDGRHEEGAGARVVDNNHLRVRGCRFLNNTTVGWDARGAGILQTGAGGSLHVEDSHFIGGRATRGGGIHVNDAPTTIYRSTFADNQLHDNNPTVTNPIGGAAILINRSTVEIVDSTFRDNQSHSSGGAILVRLDAANVTVRRSDFEHNHADQIGGHIAAVGGANLFVEQSRFRDGVGYGGGAIACWEASCEIEDSGFWDNLAIRSFVEENQRGGGGVLVVGEDSDAFLHAERNLFCHNEVDSVNANRIQSGGGAIRTRFLATGTLRNNVYAYNHTDAAGGALYHSWRLDGPGLDSRHETFIGNRAYQGCSVFGTPITTLTANLFTLSSCLASNEYVIKADRNNDIVLGSSGFYQNPGATSWNGHVNNLGGNVWTDPGLTFTPGWPLPENYECRDEYDLFEPYEGTAHEGALGHRSGAHADRIDEDGDGWSWMFDCDDQDPEMPGRGPLYPDDDGDGFGNRDSLPVDYGCPSPGLVFDNTDCDDTDDEIYPGAPEFCDELDRNCDGSFYDAAEDKLAWFPDRDGDDFGDEGYAEAPVMDCFEPEHDEPWRYVRDATDCDDTNPEVHPGATELCDELDRNCDGSFYDAAEDKLAWFPDRDGDGFGDQARADSPLMDCFEPGNSEDWRYVISATDCDDTDPTVYPGATERCDGQFNDCLALNYDPTGAPDEESDLDSDGFVACDYEGGLWQGTVPEIGQDCDDTDPTVYPGATERCDGQFNNCLALNYDPTGAPDEESDLDSDGFVACDYDGGPWRGPAPGIGADCDDADPAVYPGATEIWYDGIDQNCDGWSDFDPDRDGQIWLDYAERQADFVARWGVEDTTTGEDDCYDLLDSPLTDAWGDAVDPGDVPRPEIPYSGVDDDCSALTAALHFNQTGELELANPFDRDGDGYLVEGSREAFLAYVAQFVAFERAAHPGLDTPEAGAHPYRAAFLEAYGDGPSHWQDFYERWRGDCDDEDPAVNPGAQDLADRCLQDEVNSRSLPEHTPGPLGGGCACDGSGRAQGGLLALGLIGLLLARRRRSFPGGPARAKPSSGLCDAADRP